MGYLTDLARLRLARCSCPAAKHATSPSLPAGRGGNAPAASQTATVSKLLVERLPWLGGRRLAVLWDLENVGIFSPQATVPIQVHRLRALLTAQGAALERFVAVASGQRVQRLRHAGIQPLLEAAGVEVMCVGQASDAADALINALAHSFGTEHGQGCAVVLLSRDQDHAQQMRYLTSIGVVTIALGPFPRRKGYTQFPGRALELKGLQDTTLPAACCATLLWESTAVEVSSEEAAYLKACVQRALEAIEQAGVADGDAATSEAWHRLQQLQRQWEKSAPPSAPGALTNLLLSPAAATAHGSRPPHSVVD